MLKQSDKVHIIGIGGIGVSAIARMMLLQDKQVSGSDRDGSIVTEELKKLGAKIYYGHRASNLKDADLVIYTTAISENNPELKKAKKMSVPTLSYPKALGLISRDKYTIAVSGTHGKTTTTAMIGKILKDAKFDPTVIVGSLVKDTKSNFVAGKSNYLVCEACEYKRAFLNLYPDIIVITNIDNDHLDYYKNLEDIKKAFSDFTKKIKNNGFLIDDYSRIRLPKNFRLKIPGEHNIENAKAALAVADILKINSSTSLRALKNFTGTWRRFEYKGETKKGIIVYDDYAHHPTEIKATLRAAKSQITSNKSQTNSKSKIPNPKLYVVFQPHLYSRTKLLFNNFTKSFNDADFVIITDIYAARECKDLSVSGKKLAQNIPNALYVKKFEDIKKFLNKNTQKGDMVITMGAGDVFKIGEELIKK